MPRHKQVTTCRRNGGPLSKMCMCEHCALAVCDVCGAGEGTLTTDCPGVLVEHARQQEVAETNLDFTDARGWHLTNERRTARFEHSTVPTEPSRIDPRMLVAPTIDWQRVDRNSALQHELSLKAIAWVVADRTCENYSVKLAHVEDEAAALRGKTDLDGAERAILARLERARIDFRLSSARADRCDDEFRQMARRLFEALEQGPLVSLPGSEDPH